MAQGVKEDRGNGPMDRLKNEARGLMGALGERALSSVQEKVEEATDRLTDYVEGGAGPGLMAAVTGAKNLAEGKGPVRSMFSAGLKGATEKARSLFGKGGGKGGAKKLKVTNIVEWIDVGVPIELAYNQWTQFADFPRFMKKVENVEAADEGAKLNWKAQVFWSHRTWEATILEQVPEDKIVWRSKGPKGHVDGAVTFHELTPNLTRVLVVLEYHPQGFMERTGNIWRAQGRRVRLELKHFRRHVMSEAVLHPEEIQGWRGVIEDGEVVQDHEAAAEEERANDTEDREPEDELTDEDLEDEYQEAGEEADEESQDMSSNGQSAGGRSGDSAERARGSRRSHRPSRRPQRSDRSSRDNERTQQIQRRAVRREGGSR
jgi:uncharacterized membrane protein